MPDAVSSMRSAFLTLAALLVPLAAGHTPAGEPKNYCEPATDWSVHDYMPNPLGTLSRPVDGNTGLCGTNPPPDGHQEWAQGGAWLLVNSGPGFLIPGAAGGSIVCFGEVGHHNHFGPITLSTGGSFTVNVDDVDLTQSSPCGDGLIDNTTPCTGTCIVTFVSGLDGSYQVIVSPGEPQGHVET